MEEEEEGRGDKKRQKRTCLPTKYYVMLGEMLGDDLDQVPAEDALRGGG